MDPPYAAVVLSNTNFQDLKTMIHPDQTPPDVAAAVSTPTPGYAPPHPPAPWHSKPNQPPPPRRRYTISTGPNGTTYDVIDVDPDHDP